MRLRTRGSTTAVVFAASLLGAPVAAAQPASDTVAVLRGVAAEVVRIGATTGPTIWPGFRPDTIPLSLVFLEQGDLLVGWRGALPSGYVAVAGMPNAGWRAQRALGAASTSGEIDGRRVAQVVVDDALDPVSLTATAVHEAFHVFEGASRRPGRRFGQGENSIYVSRYPIFDVANERDMALEGRLLAAALDAPALAERRRLAQAFVAVRRERHRRIANEVREFDVQSEMNEGLAQYALVRALRATADHGPSAWRAEARRQLAAERRRLDALTTNASQSFRLRYYATGPSIALLLDALAPTGPGGWQSRLERENWTLHDALAAASGVDDVAARARTLAASRVDTTRLAAEASATIARLAELRRRLADSALSRPGLRLVLLADSLPARDVGACGFDPQNLLQLSPTAQLHARFWRPCSGAALTSELNVPSVHDERAGTVIAVVGAPAEVKLSTAGGPLAVGDGERATVTSFALDAPRATVRARRAEVARRGDTLTVRVLP